MVELWLILWWPQVIWFIVGSVVVQCVAGISWLGVGSAMLQLWCRVCGLTVAGSVFVHQVIQRGGGLMLGGSVVISDLIHAIVA